MKECRRKYLWVIDVKNETKPEFYIIKFILNGNRIVYSDTPLELISQGEFLKGFNKNSSSVICQRLTLLL